MNRLELSLQQAIQALHGRGWSQRRIARELCVNRETVAGYVHAANPAFSTSGSPATGDPNPAISPPGSGAAAESNRAISTLGSAGGRVSLCREHLATMAAVTAGLSVRRIHQDLVAYHGFAGSYQSVKRCVRGLVQQLELPFRQIESTPGEEMQVNFSQGAWIDVSGRVQPASREQVKTSHL